MADAQTQSANEMPTALPCAFVFVAHDMVGKYPWIYDQALYSVLTLMGATKWPARPSPLIRIFTDRPDRFEIVQGEVSIETLRLAELEQLIGPTRFVHRAKLQILLRATSTASGPVVFLDGDTVCTEQLVTDVARIRPNHCLLHDKESTLGQLLASSRSIRSAFALATVGEYFSPESPMYNSGVIGLHSDNFDCLERAIALTDHLCRHGRSHIWEQLAISLAIDGKATVHPATAGVVHYWAQQREYHAAIAPLLRYLRDRPMRFNETLEFIRANPIRVAAGGPPPLGQRIWNLLIGARFRRANWRPSYQALVDITNGK